VSRAVTVGSHNVPWNSDWSSSLEKKRTGASNAAGKSSWGMNTMDEGMLYHITDSLGNILCEPLIIPWEDLYWIKRTFLCSVQHGQIVLY